MATVPVLPGPGMALNKEAGWNTVAGCSCHAQAQT